MPEQHTILGGKVTSTSVQIAASGSAQAILLAKIGAPAPKKRAFKAKEISEDWYLQLRGKLRAGEIKSEKTFRDVSERYLQSTT